MWSKYAILDSPNNLLKSLKLEIQGIKKFFVLLLIFNFVLNVAHPQPWHRKYFMPIALNQFIIKSVIFLV